ncbi:678_t:CDS:2, partial [Funneliformis mosseae]
PTSNSNVSTNDSSTKTLPTNSSKNPPSVNNNGREIITYGHGQQIPDSYNSTTYNQRAY